MTTRAGPRSPTVHSGYQRIEAGQSVVLMDTGSPPALTLSAEAHAGCLSFELSAHAQRLVVNCGLPATGRGNWASCHGDARPGREAIRIRAVHDGYSDRFAIIHQRTITLAADGARLSFLALGQKGALGYSLGKLL